LYDLTSLGWGPFFAAEFERHEQEGLRPARVAVEHHGFYSLLTAEGDRGGIPSGRLKFEGEEPAVGDWVAVDELEGERKAVIHAVLPRRTKFSRKEPWKRTAEQVVAANVDVVFLVSGLGHDFNVRRLERYLTAAWNSGADPVVVLTKADLVDPSESVVDAESVAFGVPIHAVSSITGDGLDALEQYIAPGRTVALLGSSGVGKSTLVNRLLGAQRLPTAEIRSDGRGKHTTTRRELVQLPGGGLLLDTPGMRELQLWDAADGIGRAFGDIQELAARCKFRDCRHQSEPGCAVRAAVDAQALASERLENFRKLEREERFLEAKQDAAVRAQRSKELRRMMKSVNRFFRDRGR